MFRPRPVSTQKSRLTKTQRILIATLSSVFILSGVAFSTSAALRAKLGLARGSKPAILQEPQAPPKRVRLETNLLRFAGIEKRERAFSLTAPVAPTVTATKTDSLFTDVDNDLQADPGDTIKYTVNISASGQDATGVTFTDTVDPNTAFVPGSLTATPVAVDDSYAATGNIRISVAAPGVLGNDFTGVPAATITAPPSTSTNGGNVALNADGSFTYNPPAGFEGVDTFSYTLTNGSGSNNATVSITVSGMIWFIDNNAAACTTLAGGCGRLTNPFSSLSAFAALNNGAGNNPAANDNIFVYESATDYVGPVTLLNGQRFLGQDSTASLSAMTGLTPPAGSDPLPATNSGNGVIVNITNGNAITVGSGNTLRGFTGGDSTTDITGSGFGTLTISDVTLNGAGQALNLTTGTLAATFGGISSTNSGTTGITLTSVAGSLTSPTNTITNPTGIGISVGTSSATLSFGSTTSTLSGGTGVSLLTNSGTITFGSLNISPDAGQRGLLATNNSNTITATSGTISTSSATAVEITRASSTTPLSITLTKVTSTGGTANGITLQNTSGGFTVAGSGGTCTTAVNCTGGNIANKTGADGTTQGIGIYLNNASNVSITRMKLNDFSNHAVRGTNVTSFTLNNSFIDGVNGDNVATSEGTIVFDGLFGTSSFAGDTIKGGFTENVRIANVNGVSDVTIDSCTIRDTSIAANGNDNVQLRTNVNAIMTAHVTNNTFAATNGDHLQTIAGDQSSMTIVATGNSLSGGGGPSALGQGITISGGNAVPDSTETVRFNISNNGTAGNPMTGTVQGGAINVNQGSGNGNWQGQINNNFIGNAAVQCSGASQSSGIRLENHSKGVMVGTVSGNTVRQTCGAGGGMSLTAGDNTASGLGNGPLNATVTNNSVIVPAGLGSPFNDDHGIVLIGGNVSGNTNQVCFDVKNNTTQGNTAVGSAGQGFRIRQRFGSTVSLPGFAGPFTGAAAVTAVRLYILARPNTASGDPSTPNNGDVSVTVQAPGAFANGGAGCTAPIVPTFAQLLPDSEESAAFNKSASRAGGDAEGDGGSGAEPSTEDILRATRGEGPGLDDSGKVSQAQLLALAPAAIERWRQTGISIDDLARLQAVTFEVADLPEGQLASSASNHVKIDESAAGYGWYNDASPLEDAEFDVSVLGNEMQTTEFSVAKGRVDLLTVIMRELGVAFQHGDSNVPDQLRSLLQTTLSPDVRRLPDSRNIQLPTSGASAGNDSATQKSLASLTAKASALRSKTGGSGQASAQNAAINPVARTGRVLNHVSRNRTRAATLSSMLADVMLNIGTLPAGESVTITFKATVDDPFAGALPQVSNQGTVSGSNFANVLTDDPTVGGAADPTVTPIDLPSVSVAVSPSSVAEDGATNLVYTFTRTGSTANAQTINFNVGGTASFTEPDYTQTGAATFTASSGTVTLAAGSSTAVVTIDPSADTTVEPDETVSLTVTSGTGYTVGSPSSASGTITNDDTDVSVAVSPASVAEDGATNLVYTFTRVGVTSSSLTVNFNVGGTATFGVSPDDYTQTGATTFTTSTGSVTFAPGNSTASVTVNPETDSIVEPDETVALTVAAGTGYNVGSPASATGTIINDDTDVSVAVSPGAVAEDGATNLVYTFTRNGVTSGALTVNFSVGGSATFGVSPNDYTQTGATSFTTTTGTVTFSAGNSTATVTIDPEADTTVEPDETVNLTVTAGAGYNVASPSSAAGTITNDDTDVSVAVSPASVAEDGASNLVYTFTRAGVTSNSLTVNFSVGGSATFGASPNDYTQTGATSFTTSSGSVTFGAGNSTATVTVNPESDSTVEADETVDLTVTSGASYNVGSPSSASATITNDDTSVSVAVSPGSVSEDGATNLVYTFTRVGVTGNALAVNFSVGGTANFGVSPDDYTQTGATAFTPVAGVVTFTAGSPTATVTIDPEADSTVEPDETVDLTVIAGVGYNVGVPASASGTITNDDTDVIVAVSPASVAEDGATDLVYTFTRNGVTTNSLTVNFSVGGSAVFGVSPNDYTQTGAASFTTTTGSVTFAPGSPTATVTINPETDSTVEPDETVDLTLTAGAGYNIGSPFSASGTITNDDTDVSMAVSPASVAEDGATNLVYTFTRTGVTAGSLTVNFSVGGSATFGASPDDYTQSGATTFTTTSGSVTFGAGNSTATVTVNPETDSTVETDETVDLTVTAGAGYNIGAPSSASGTIVNDDTDVSVAVSPAAVAEDAATNLVYTFTRNGVTSGALTVNFSVGGTATFGVTPNDYTQTGATTFNTTTGSVTFGAGNSTATVTVNPETDTTIETDETVSLTLTAGAGYNVSSPASATGTITNDDADVSVTVSPAAVTEDGATNLVYTFNRVGFTGGALTVNFSVGGTATFGVTPDDYTQTGATTFTTTTGSVTFAPGSPTATVTVDPETDLTAESDETVIITLTGGASYNAVSPNSATGTILNDDTLVSVVVSPSSTAEGGANMVYTFTRTGPTGSALTVNFSAGGSASFPSDYSQSGATTFSPPNATVTFGVGSATATVTVMPLSDCVVEGSETVDFTVQPGTGYGVGSPASASGTIANTPDSTAPTITLIPNVNKTLWPPNHQYESVAVTDFVASASDSCDAGVNLNSVYILKITSDEVENGNGDGNTLNDIVIGATCKTAQLRSERDGSADGRVYTITFKVKDNVGNFTTATAKVTVRKNPNTPAVDSGTHYTVNSACP
jgi:hypothetical protein